LHPPPQAGGCNRERHDTPNLVRYYFSWRYTTCVFLERETIGETRYTTCVLLERHDT
jgi:hypothetical protein